MTLVGPATVETSSHLIAYVRIKSKLLNGEFQANQRLTDSELAEQVGLSRTPVREALRLLENDGLVEYSHGKGWIVCAITPTAIREIFEIKLRLESHAAALAAERAISDERLVLVQTMERMAAAERAGDTHTWIEQDRILHDHLLTAAHNGRMKQTIVGLNDQWYRLRIGITGMTRRMSDSLLEHRAIVDCVVNGDAEGASRATHAHLSAVLVSVEEVLNSLLRFKSEGL